MHKEYLVIDYSNHVLIGVNAADYAIGSYFEDHETAEYKEALYNKTYKILDGMLRTLKRTFPDSILIACCDTAGGTKFRRELYPSYKANRTVPKKITHEQMKDLEALYIEWGTQFIHIPEIEGDDAIYVTCKLLKEKDPKNFITIISRDRDLLQVVQAGYADNQYDVSKKQMIEVPPYLVTEMKAMVGDTSDNISGLPRVGEKTALKYLTGMKQMTEEQKAIYENNLNIIDASRHPRLKENIEAARELLKSELL